MLANATLFNNSTFIDTDNVWSDYRSARTPQWLLWETINSHQYTPKIENTLYSQTKQFDNKTIW